MCLVRRYGGKSICPIRTFKSRQGSFPLSFSSAGFEHESKKHRKERMRKCVKDYHQSSSFIVRVDDVASFSFVSSLSIVVNIDVVVLT